MARIHLITAVGLTLLGVTQVVAKEPYTTGQDYTGRGVDAPSGPRSYSQHAFTKLRVGSMLHSDTASLDAAPDLRGPLEKRRDAELIRHYSRLATLDTIVELAEKAKDTALAERSEEVRRKEMQRFHASMQELRQATWREIESGSP